MCTCLGAPTCIRTETSNQSHITLSPNKEYRHEPKRFKIFDAESHIIVIVIGADVEKQQGA